MAGIFLSYRRNDSAGYAGRLFDRLTAHFGDDRVFMDVDTLVPSERFASKIERAIAGADVMLVLIGPRWAEDAPRLADPDDFVRRELLAALRVDCRVIPVSLDGAAIPDESTLPQELRAVVRSEGVTLRHAEFGRDADHLIDVLSAFVKPSPEATRRCVSRALLRAGWPFSWFGSVVRRVPLRAALASLCIALVVAWTATMGVIYAKALSDGWEAGSKDATEKALTSGSAAIAERAFILRGRVKDSANHDLEDAAVTLTNFQTGQSIQATTNSDGGFQVDLRAIDVTRDTLIDLVVAKARYRKQTDRFSYLEGFAYRSVLQPEAGVGGAQ
jgi:hypothetical protein